MPPNFNVLQYNKTHLTHIDCIRRLRNVFCGMTLCGLVEIYNFPGNTYFLFFQGEKCSCSLRFLINIRNLTCLAHYGPAVDSASNRNEYQEYFLWGKGGRCVGLTTLPPSCAVCFQIWEPQPPGTLRACPGL